MCGGTFSTVLNIICEISHVNLLSLAKLKDIHCYLIQVLLVKNI